LIARQVFNMRRILSSLRYSAYKILLYEASIIGVIIALSLLQGHLSVNTVATNWIYAGFIIVGVGVLSTYGAWGSTRSFRYQHGSSVSRSVSERFDDYQRDMGQAFGFFGQSLVIGLVAIFGGAILSFIVSL
jgi:hypothetical protein